MKHWDFAADARVEGNAFGMESVTKSVRPEDEDEQIC
jgi:hypothetical protein